MKREQIRRVVVISSPRKPVGQDIAEAVAAWLRREKLEVIEDFQGDIDLTAIEADLAISIGGDGTVLTTARRMREKPIPTMGVNVGKLGFLAEFSDAEVRDWIAGRKELPTRIVPRMFLKCTVNTGDKAEVRYALNDASVQQGLMTRLLRIDMWVDGSHAIEYRCDGLIVATPVGSTAYSLSVGGPIVTPDLNAFIVAPIAPHTLTNRPVVAGHRQVLKFAFRSAANEMALVFDGHEKIRLEADSTFQIEAAEQTFPLVSHGNRSFYYLLRQKLGWGEKPHYTEEH
ncbi:MAG: NAD(+)/NADH kinase [Planctomycetota bacterium]|nr:NAD(+)/NADH kinase [Planctomycetota bacterium]